MTNRQAAVDLAFLVVVFLLCAGAEPWLDPLLRRGHGLPGVLGLAGYQFLCEGLALLVILTLRREPPSTYGLRLPNLSRSLGLAILLAALNDLALSWHAKVLLWVPFARQPAARISLSSDLSTAVIGLALTVAVWGMLESFFGVVFARKVNALLGHNGRGWVSPGAISFGLFNGAIHLAVGQGTYGFVTSLASGYAIAVIPAVTGNAWGSALFQSLTNAVGQL